MDNNYNWEGAGETLAKIAAERTANNDAGILQLSEVTKPKNWADEFTFTWSHTNTCHLIYLVKENMPTEEVVFAIQGIIYKHDLPPFEKEISSPERIRYLRQSVSLTGLGTPIFEAAIQGIMDVYALFSRSVSRDKLQQCSFLDTYWKYSGIEMTNRYFSLRKDFPLSENLPFHKDVDPKGILTRATGTNFIHVEQNLVAYYEYSEVPEGNSSYKTIAPVKFCSGDLVEAQITLMLVPLKGGLFKLTPVLRCLTILDSTFSQLALAASVSKRMAEQPPLYSNKTTVFKRKVGYQDQEVNTAREKLRRMELDNADDEHTNTASARQEKD